MTSTVAESTRRLSVRQSHGRVMNEIAAFFRKRLTVPHIYLKPRIPGREGVDLLAVDLGGSGDVHGVEIKVWTIPPLLSGIRKLITPIKSLPVHYKYIAINANHLTNDKLSQLRNYEELFDPSGIGRVGVISFDERLLQKNADFDPSLLSILVTPERFLVRGEKLVTLEKFLDKAPPDMRVRI